MPFTGKLGNSNSLLGDIILGSQDAGGASPTDGRLGVSGAVLSLMVLGWAPSGGMAAAVSVDATDTGSSADVGSTTASVSASEFVTSIDSPAPSGSAQYTPSDDGVAVDVSTTTATISSTETVTAQDVASLTSVLVNVAETPTGAEAVTTTATFSASDSGSMSDSPVPGMGTSETSHGTDTASYVDITAACDATSGTIGPALQRLGPEYFLPHWTTANSDKTGLLYALCQWGAETEVLYKNQAARALTGRFLVAARVLEPLFEWTVNYVPASDREYTFTYQATTGSGSVTGTARRAISQFDYDTAVDPVWYQDTNARVIRLRNLFMRQIQRFTSGTVYTICGSDAAGYLGVVPDTGYFYRRNPANNWEWIGPESDRFGADTVNLPGSGTWQIAYGSWADLASLLDSGTVVVSYLGGITRSLPLQFTPVSNLFDGYGFLLGIPRIQQPIIETNTSYKARMVSTVLAPPDTTLTGVLRGISSDFNLLRRAVWDGVSTITLDSLGSQKITSITVVGVDRFFEVQETLYSISSGNTVFYSTFSNWRQGGLVFVNGIPTNTYSLSGNRLTFFQPVTGSVQVIYSSERYTPLLNSNGYIYRVSPGQGLASGSYNIIYTSAVNAHVVDQPDYQTTSLLTAAGLPNALFSEIAAKLTENNPTTFGRARWGIHSTWFELTDDKPEISRLPIPFDDNTPNG